MKNNKTAAVRMAAVGAVGAVAIGFWSAGAASADTFVPLPDNEISKTLIDGTTVTVKGFGQSGLISPSMSATPTQRNVWVTGNYTVETSNATGGKIEPGFLVGCQVDFGAGIGGGAGASFGQGNTVEMDPGNPLSLSIDRTQPNTYNIGAGVYLDLAPGQLNDVKLVGDETTATIDGVDVATQVDNSFSFDGNGGGFTYADETLSVAGCAGFAEARSYVDVTIETPTVTSTVTLWGQPFSIG
ncbi:MspA family porin [Rhodococcus sp. BP-252]|uniref:MspA protein n=1 Tax=Rhodococcoides kyotonense TaxID=398843 RepID=A0A177YIF5_9NOCA|nr:MULTISPECIES: MspA family porin [Rhodococcus]MBY6414582.1 MspA family porin [Rhodococcus sp. BP-320]MBY6419339.1 MspA family porin [Rhodococcus sp. BP-321]MBY6424321.1 MspA family porin [Rhodococcus sp. BP-324]MBY6429418.1 MspA family porin [Rhodococcus sp. BP-323]MBY6431937.1 MspA family porin [Rhodococcus sp. BP-322]